MATFLFAATLSGIGMFLQAAALGKQIYDITDSTLAIGMLGLVEFTPALILLPLTGSAADRFDRRLIVGVGLSFEVFTSILYFAYATTEPTGRGSDLSRRRAFRHGTRVRVAGHALDPTARSRRSAACPG